MYNVQPCTTMYNLVQTSTILENIILVRQFYNVVKPCVTTYNYVQPCATTSKFGKQCFTFTNLHNWVQSSTTIMWICVKATYIRKRCAIIYNLVWPCTIVWKHVYTFITMYNALQPSTTTIIYNFVQTHKSVEKQCINLYNSEPHIVMLF